MEEMSLLVTSWKEKVEKLEKTGRWKWKIVVKLTVYSFCFSFRLFSRVRKFTRVFRLSASSEWRSQQIWPRNMLSRRGRSICPNARCQPELVL
jgi:hypothetical protein